jgi:hypothetical protein
MTNANETTIRWDGDEWRVIARGVTRDDGATFCHLGSVTRFVAQRNGKRAIQIVDWIPASILRA